MITTRSAFLASLAEMLELDPSQVTETSLLKDLPNWDSMAIVSFIALADSELNTLVRASELVKCQTVADLIKLFPAQLVG